MFISKTITAKKYFKYLFAVLQYVIEKRGLAISGGNNRYPNYRYPAYIAERFLNLFIFAENLKPYFVQQIILEAEA